MNSVSKLKSALIKNRGKIKSAPKNKVYGIIDKIMRQIAKSDNISGKELHDMWVKQYKIIPDKWILKEEEDKGITIPKIGLTFSRILMPQLGNKQEFLKNLSLNNVSYDEKVVDPVDLRASQQEFDTDKIAVMMLEPFKSKSDIVISNDNYILDGHHRWIVALNKKQKLRVIQVDLPILELMRMAKSFENTTYKPIVECVRNVIKSAITKRIY